MCPQTLGFKALAILAFCSTLGAQQVSTVDKSHIATGPLVYRFETVSYVSADVLATNREDLRNFVRTPFEVLFDGLDALEGNLSRTIIPAADVFLGGTKDYHSPSAGLGRVHSTFCYVVVLHEAVPSKINRLFAPRGRATGPTRTWRAAISEYGEDDPRKTTFYAARVGDLYLVVSNDRDELEAVTRLIQSPKKEDATRLTALTDWEQIIQHRGFWTYRQIRHGPSEDRFASATDVLSPSARALLVYIEPQGAMGTIRLMASTAEDPSAENINRTNELPPLRRLDHDVWETTFPLSHAGSYPDATFWVWRLFGQGAFI